MAKKAKKSGAKAAARKKLQEGCDRCRADAGARPRFDGARPPRRNRAKKAGKKTPRRAAKRPAGRKTAAKKTAAKKAGRSRKAGPKKVAAPEDQRQEEQREGRQEGCAEGAPEAAPVRRRRSGSGIGPRVRDTLASRPQRPAPAAAAGTRRRPDRSARQPRHPPAAPHPATDAGTAHVVQPARRRNGD